MHEVSMGRNVTISISDRSGGAGSTSLCPWNQGEKPDCSSIPDHFIQASLVHLYHSKALLMTLVDVFNTGGLEGLQHQGDCSLALSGHLWELFDKNCHYEHLRNTSLK